MNRTVTAALAVFGSEVILVDKGISRLWSREKWLFALVGGFVALLGHELLQLLIAVGVAAGMANVLQAVVTLQVNFVANRHLTWRRRIAGSGVGIWTRWRRFQLARGAGLLLSVAAFPHVAPWTGPSTAYWCNPRRQALGQAPTTRTTVHGLGALLWIKRPGESDGICGGERTYPFSPTQARRLIANSPHVPESYRRLAAAAKSP